MKKISLISIVLIGILGCRNNDIPFEVEKDGVKLTLPGFVKEDELAEDGMVEYANRFRNFYVVLMPSKETNTDSFRTQSIARLSGALEKPSIDTISQDSSSAIYEINGYYPKEKEPIYYYLKLATIHNKNYSLTVWTRGKERKKKYQDTIYQILNSLKSSQTN